MGIAKKPRTLLAGMRTTSSDSDASFYSFVHSIVKSLEGEGGRRLRHARVTGSALYRIAVDDGGGIPDDDRFVQVPCHDITSSSFSFFISELPPFCQLVIAFELPGREIFAQSRVVRTGDVLIHESGEVERLQDTIEVSANPHRDAQAAIPMVLVECEMLKRLEP